MSQPLNNPRSSRAGYQPFVPTKEQRDNVEALAGHGVPPEDICRLVINPRTGLPIDDKTLRRHFRSELDSGYVKANDKVVQSLYAQASGGNVTAAIWWTKARMGGSERLHSGKGGGPSQTEVRSARERIAARARPGRSPSNLRRLGRPQLPGDHGLSARRIANESRGP